jgi:hypothetical protein
MKILGTCGRKSGRGGPGRGPIGAEFSGIVNAKESTPDRKGGAEALKTQIPCLGPWGYPYIYPERIFKGEDGYVG